MSKATKNPDQAWEVVKLYASQEHGLERYMAGLGSPGSRYDVWTDDEFKKAARAGRHHLRHAAQPGQGAAGAAVAPPGQRPLLRGRHAR